MSLPSNEHTFVLKIDGERTKQTFDGTFTVRCLLTNAEIIEVGLRIDQYNKGSQTVPPGVALLNRALAELDVRIMKSPSWWKESDGGRNLLDTNVIYEVFSKSLEAEKIYDERIAEAAKKSDAAADASTKRKKDKESSG